MEPKVLLLAASLAFIPSLSHASTLPNLCDDVYLDSNGVPIHDAKGITLSRYCDARGPDAPWWGASVCCAFGSTGAHCAVPDARDGCGGAYEMWCDHGEEHADGSVTCYQVLPDACDAGYCVAAPDVPPTEWAGTAMCCGGGSCIPADIGDHCEGEYIVCQWGITYEDGTVECFD